MSAVAVSRVAELLAHPRYEVLPFGDIEEAVLEHVPPAVTVTVTMSPQKGIEPTLDLAERLAAHGYSVVPHLSARLVREIAATSPRLLARVDGSGRMTSSSSRATRTSPRAIRRRRGPARGVAELGHRFEQVGITGYPESHALISDDDDDPGHVRRRPRSRRTS